MFVQDPPGRDFWGSEELYGSLTWSLQVERRGSAAVQVLQGIDAALSLRLRRFECVRVPALHERRQAVAIPLKQWQTQLEPPLRRCRRAVLDGCLVRRAAHLRRIEFGQIDTGHPALVEDRR